MIFLRTTTLFVLVFLVSTCITYPRIKNPESALETKNQGIAVFGLFVYDPEEKSIESSQKGAIYIPDQLEYFVVSKVNNKDKTVSMGEFVNRNPLVIKKGLKRFKYTNSVNLAPWFLVRTYNPEIKYALRRLTYRESCGRNCGRENDFQIPPYFSQKNLPISSPARKIHFMGLFMLNKIILKDGGFFRINEESGYFIEDGIPVLAKQNNRSMNKHFFGEEEQTLKGAEIHFLKKFIKNQEEGHWAEAAKTRLKALGVTLPESGAKKSP